MKGAGKKQPSQPTRGMVGLSASRRTLLPPVDPTMRFSVPSSSAQQIRFQLSGFDEMPAFKECNEVIPVAGRSLPKFRIESLGASTTKMSTNPNNRAISPKYLRGDQVKGNKKSLLSRFDDTISNPNLRVTQTKAIRMKKQIQKDLEKRVKNSGTDVFRDEMEKMKDKFLGNITSELGFGYDNLSSGGRQAQELKGSRNFESFDTINGKIDGMMREWTTDSQKMSNSKMSELQRNSSIPKNRNRPPVKRLPNSNDKLAELSQGFRQSLHSFSSRDPRELIKTPQDDLISKFSDEHSRVLNNKQCEEEKGKGASNQNPKGVGSRSILSMKSSLVNPRVVGSGILPLNKRPSKSKLKDSDDLRGIMDFRTLLENQRNSPFEKSGEEPEPGPHRKNIIEQLNPHPKSKKLGAQKSSTQKLPSQVFIAGTPVHGRLKESVKTIDQAAKMAEKLGTLMSRVAVQQKPMSQMQDSLTSSRTTLNNSTGQGINSKASMQSEASDLRKVAEEAKKSLTMHTVACGNSPRGRVPPTKSNGLSPASKRTSDTEIQTQTDVIETDGSDNQVFKFTPEMSYTDQLILKKLRETRSSYSTESMPLPANSRGAGQNKLALISISAKASFASTKKK